MFKVKIEFKSKKINTNEDRKTFFEKEEEDVFNH